MSRSLVQCRKCHLPLGQRHHSGTIDIAEHVKRITYLKAGKLLLTCQCGQPRTLEPEADHRAAYLEVPGATISAFEEALPGLLQRKAEEAALAGESEFQRQMDRAKRSGRYSI